MDKQKHNKHTLSDLYQMQSLPLSAKIKMTKYRIRQWYEAFDGNVYVSFSGGKDSTVLLHIARQMYPDIEAVFVNTGLEYPSVRRFALSQENVTELRPDMNFRDVVIKYGYPIIGKEVAGYVDQGRKHIKKGMKTSRALKRLRGESVRSDGKKSMYNREKYEFLLYAPFIISDRCCGIMKKHPIRRYANSKGLKPIIGTMAQESKLRQSKWLRNGCNAFDMKEPNSNPMSFYTENDILTYIHENNLEIAEAYGDVVVDNKGQVEGQINMSEITGDYKGCNFRTTGCKRTGCIFCLFGITQDKNRILNLQKQEPKLADYVLRGGEWSEDMMWQPNKDGMGYWFVLDWLSEHGIKIPYENAEHYRERYGNERTMELLGAEISG